MTNDEREQRRKAWAAAAKKAAEEIRRLEKEKRKRLEDLAAQHPAPVIQVPKLHDIVPPAPPPPVGVPIPAPVQAPTRQELWRAVKARGIRRKDIAAALGNEYGDPEQVCKKWARGRAYKNSSKADLAIRAAISKLLAGS